jgi:hypothetical protein
MSKSWKAEVLAHGEKAFVGNGLYFETKEEAEAYAADLFSRWTAVDQWRVVEVAEAANYHWDDGTGAEPIVPEVLKRDPVGYTEAEINASQARLVALFGEEELNK